MSGSWGVSLPHTLWFLLCPVSLSCPWSVAQEVACSALLLLFSPSEVAGGLLLHQVAPELLVQIMLTLGRGVWVPGACVPGVPEAL